jgi:hypothetical protein
MIIHKIERKLRTMKSLKILCVGLTVFSAVASLAQTKTEDTPAKLVNRYCDSKGADSKAYEVMLAHPNPQSVADAISVRSADTSGIDQTYCVYLIRGLTKKQTNVAVRAKYMNALSQIAFLTRGKTSSLAVNSMKYFKKNEFTTAVLENLEIIILNRPQYCSDAILMYGFAAPVTKSSFLKQAQQFQKYSKTDQRNVSLALVRMGDQEEVKLFLDELNTKPINDIFVQALLTDLTYTRNSKVFTILLNALANDVPACSSANNDSDEKILCAYRILEQIAPYINSFPIAINKYNEIEGDYPTALATAKLWYDQNKDKTTLNTSTY